MELNESFSSAIEAENLVKRYEDFKLEIPEFKLPEGFISALIGENGAGKSTLLRALSGARMDYRGTVRYFRDQKNIDDEGVRSRIGYTAPGDYFFPHWRGNDIRALGPVLYPGFSEDTFDRLCQEMAVAGFSNRVSQMSDGNKMKLEIASVLARNTDVLIMDEPASPLDPLMREKLCDLMRQYISDGNGDKTVFISTHNVSDLESAVDYCYFMADGRIIEQGFTEDLKTKYILVSGSSDRLAAVTDLLVSSTHGMNSFTGLALSDNQNRIMEAYYNSTGADTSGSDKRNSAAFETPTLEQISVGLLRKYSRVS